jgi:regulatory protein
VDKPVSRTIIERARRWCALQERCQSELRSKLFSWQASAGHIEAIISQLIGEGFLNEARFAEHYAVSKSRQKGWGPRKIESALRARQVSEPCIRAALKGIDAEEREHDLQRAVMRRWERTGHLPPVEQRVRLFRYFVGKGFAVEAVEQALDAMLHRA